MRLGLGARRMKIGKGGHLAVGKMRFAAGVAARASNQFRERERGLATYFISHTYIVASEL